MNRLPFALWAAIVLSVSPAAPARAQVCPWGMHAQLQMQIQWQQQQTMQQHFAAYLQMQQAHQQAWQQHLIQHTVATQQLQALHIQHVTLQRNAVALHMNYTHLQRNAAALSMNHTHLQRNIAALHTQPTHLLRNTATLHMNHTHLQRNTVALHMQTTQLQRNAVAFQTQHTHLQRNTAALTANRVTVQSHHSPSVQIRASMGMTCGHCHQGQPSAPNFARNPPGNPFQNFLTNIPRRPVMPWMIGGQVRPMPKAIAQLPRQPLLPFVAARPAIQPIVVLPRTMPLGAIPVRLPMQPVGAPRVAAVTPSLGPIALLQPPPLPMIRKPLHLVPLPATTRSPATSPGDSMRRESTETTSASLGDSVGPATPSSLTDTVAQLVSRIAQGKPSERCRDDDPEATPILPEIVRQAPPRPVLEAKYPLPPLMTVPARSETSATTKPSLVEVVLRPPQLPALPEPAAQTTSVP
jgi:hypothetical protein